jgi:hypothetical protein
MASPGGHSPSSRLATSRALICMYSGWNDGDLLLAAVRIGTSRGAFKRRR